MREHFQIHEYIFPIHEFFGFRLYSETTDILLNLQNIQNVMTFLLSWTFLKYNDFLNLLKNIKPVITGF